MKFNAIKLGSLPASVVPARSGFTCRRGFKLGRTHRRPDRVLPASYLFGVVAARANGARTLVRRKVGWRRGLEVTQRESAVPAFLRDKSRAPGPSLVGALNTYLPEVSDSERAKQSSSRSCKLQATPLPAPLFCPSHARSPGTGKPQPTHPGRRHG